MCRNELSAAIARLMSKYLWSGWKWWGGVKEIASPFPECSWKKTQIEKNANLWPSLFPFFWGSKIRNFPRIRFASSVKIINSFNKHNFAILDSTIYTHSSLLLYKEILQKKFGHQYFHKNKAILECCISYLLLLLQSLIKIRRNMKSTRLHVFFWNFLELLRCILSFI